MKTLIIILIVLVVLSGCSGCSVANNTASPVTPDVTILTVDGDKENLPQYVSQLGEVQIGDDPNADAILISRELFEKARSVAELKSWLQSVVFKTILLVYEGDPYEVAEVLELKSPTMMTENSTYIVAAIRATDKVVIGGGILVSSTNRQDITLKDLEDYLIQVQKQVR